MKTDYNQLFAFVQLAEAGSFRKAAQQLGLSPSALSHSLKRLEQQTGHRLFHRTTRSLGLTEAGTALYRDLSPLYSQINQAISELRQQHGEQGLLRR